MLDKSQLDEMQQIAWYHRIDLGGVVTPGSNRSDFTLKTLHIPEDLSGKTFLDIGAWDGCFSFEAERRGAARVMAVDSVCWSDGRKRGFEFARKTLRSSVEDRFMEVLDISPETVGVHDVVLFSGVLYHMRHPLLALEKVASVTGDHLILETLLDAMRVRSPAMIYYPGDSMNKDGSNWWGPNALAVCEMLREVGFRRVEIVNLLGVHYRFAHALNVTMRGREKLWTLPSRVVNRGRGVFHAWK